MESIINDPWVIAMVSGVAVALISGFVFSKTGNKEYRQKIVTANQEIMQAMRRGIPEGKLAPLDVLSSLVTATASKYNVEEYDLYKPKDVADHLIKEVMDSSFISVDLQHKYCKALSSMKKQDLKLQLIKDKEKQDSAFPEKQRLRLASGYFSVMLGTIAAAMTMIVSMPRSEIGNNINVLIPTFAITLIVFAITFMSLLLQQYFKRIENRLLAKKREKMLHVFWGNDKQNT